MSGPNTNYDPVEVSALDPAQVDAAVEQALAAIAAAASLDDLKAVRIAHQGEKSALALANREIGALPPSAKAEAGKRVGQARGRVGAGAHRAPGRARGRARRADPRRGAGRRHGARVLRRAPGARHPIELVAQRLVDAFVGMGWEVAEGPELESEWLNFDALNLGPDHPARQMQDTFFLDPVDSGLVLRTQTSPVQIRTMLEQEPPIYVVAPGQGVPHRRPRRDAHAGLPPDRVPRRRQGPDDGPPARRARRVRPHHVRRGAPGPGCAPSYFPFTEPSHGDRLRLLRLPRHETCGSPTQCRTCGGSGWIELGGSGMVNRKVLRACGIDPDVYSGFAFGLGIERALHAAPRGPGHARDGRGRRALLAAVRDGRSEMRMPLELARRVHRPRPRSDRRRRRCRARLGRARGGGPPRWRHHRARSSSAASSTSRSEPQKNGKPIRWCAVDVGQNGQMLTRGQAPGDRLRGPQLRGRRPRRRRPARRHPARRLPDRRAQDLRPHVQRHDLRRGRDRPRARPRGHHRPDPPAR